MASPELVRITCLDDHCPAWLIPRSRLGSVVRCSRCGLRFNAARGDAFGRKQWDACPDPAVLRSALDLLNARPSPRKRRLVAVAVTRAVFDWCRSPLLAQAVAAADDWARTGAPPAAAADARRELEATRRWSDWPAAAAWCVAAEPELACPAVGSLHREVLAAAVREVIPNPFRSPAVLPGWRTSAVLGLATAVDVGAADGARPILADALEEAGCTEYGLLAHLRGDGPHTRGCWAVDAVLGQ